MLPNHSVNRNEIGYEICGTLGEALKVNKALQTLR